MSYTEFIVRWVRDHEELSDRTAAQGAQVAWERHNNAPMPDTYAHWMPATILELSMLRALDELNRHGGA